MYLPTRAAKLNMYGMSWREAEHAACICLLNDETHYIVVLIVQTAIYNQQDICSTALC